MGCTAEPDCSADGGLALSCAAAHRTCVMNGAVSMCDVCLPGYTDSSGTCVAVPTCGGPNIVCKTTEYCDANQTCQPLPCMAGQAKDTAGNCQTCTSPNCTPTGTNGLSGRYWPYMVGGGSDTCICETLDGWYWPTGGASTALQCDADHDGWVRQEAADLIAGTDPALKANARCKVRSIDRVRLVDEYGAAVDVFSCNTGLTPFYPPDAGLDAGPPPACTIAPIRLTENKALDTAPTAPPFGPNGRVLTPAELSPLTKGCVAPPADYNADSKDDQTEVQSSAPTTEADKLLSFAYFMELYTSWFEPDVAGGTSGHLVIRERSRCASDFPLRYDPNVTNTDGGADKYDPDAGGTYWRNCSRARDPQWISGTSSSTYDFAQYTCGGAACPVVPPPHVQYIAPTDPKKVILRNFGLCELNGQPPKDGQWRGLLHHSQFKCVTVTNSVTPGSSYQHLPSDFGPGTGKLTFNSCSAYPCDGGFGCSPLAGPPGNGLQNQLPAIGCTVVAMPTTTSQTTVGFAAVNYKPYGSVDGGYTALTYQGGCVNEDTQYGGYVCPYPQFLTSKAAGDLSFGRFSCYGNGQNFLWWDSSPPDMTSTMFWNGPLGPDGGPTNPTNSVLR
jgi:hypothetical protein